MPRSSNDSYMDFYSAGGPGGSAVGMGGLGGSSGGAGRSAGGNSGSANDYHAQGGPGGNFSNQGGLGGGGYDGPSFSGSGTGFADSNQGGGSSPSAPGAPSGRGPSDAGTDNYFGGSPNRGTDNMGGVASIGGGLSSRSTRGLGAPGLTDTIGGGLNPGSRSTYGRSEAGGLSVSNTVGNGLGRGRSLANVYGRLADTLAESGVRNLSGAPSRSIGTKQAYGKYAESLGRSPYGNLSGKLAPSSRYLDMVVDAIIHHESRGKATAKNPNSTAYGPAQFTKGTWRNTLAKHRPDLLQKPAGMSKTEFDKQVQALRADPKLARDMAKALIVDNAKHLSKRGREVTPRSLYLAHFLGAGGATTVLGAKRSAAVSDYVTKGQIAANRSILGGNKTVGRVIDWAEGVMRPAYSALAMPTDVVPTARPDGPDWAGTGGLGGRALDGYGGAQSIAEELASEPTAPQFPVSMDLENRPMPLPDLGDGDFPGRVPVDFPTPQNPGLWTNPHKDVDLEDRPGNEHLLAPSAPASTEPESPTFEETYLQPAEAAPPNAPMPAQRGTSTVRDVVPSDWQRPSEDPWDGLRQVDYGDDPIGDPWADVRTVTDPWAGLRADEGEQRLKSIGGRLLSGTIDSGLAVLPGIGLVNLATKMVSGLTIGEAIASGAFEEVEDWANTIEGEGTNVAISEQLAANDDENEPDSVEEFVSTYLTGNKFPTPAIRWGRSAA